MLLERYAPASFAGQTDFEQNFHIDVPANFNFAFDCVDELARTKPDAPALVWCDYDGNEASYTFAEVAARQDAAARYFASLGLGRGDTVMLMLKRRAQFWFATLGLIKLGAVAIPATHQLTAKDLIYRNNAASIAAIVAVDDADVMNAAEQSLAGSPSLKFLIKTGEDARAGWLNFDGGLAANMRGADLPRVTQNDDDLFIYFTSGTTGPPKMVAHNQIYPLGHIVTARFWQNLHPGSLHLTVADTGWAKASWGKLFGQWLCEAAVFVYDHDYFDVKKLMEVLSRHKVTSFCAPPTIFRYVVRTNLDEYDLSALEWVTTAGEPLNPDVSRRFKEKTGLDIREGYGQTETTPVILTTPYMEPKFGSLGRPNPEYHVKLLDADGAEVPQGENGEISIFATPGKTPGIFTGYYRDPARTAAIWQNNVYHTGDLAFQRPDGYYDFVGRADDVIKVASYRIGPFEVESVLIEHPAVVECAVTGAPDEKRGQTVKASIILAEGYAPGPALAAELQQYVKDNTAPYKYPRIVEFVTELPKTISGKIKRAEIRKESR